MKEKNLLPGEKRALAQGLDILSDSQMAAIYLSAKDAAGRSEDTRGRGDNFLTRNAKKMMAGIEDGFEKLSAPRLADALGLKHRTVSYTCSKYRLLIQGNREGTESNVLYNKIISSFDGFQKMSSAELYLLASQAIDPNTDFSESDKFLAETALKAKKAKEKIMKQNNCIALSAMSLYNGLKDKLGDRIAIPLTLSQISSEKNIPIEELRTIIKTYLKNDRILAKKF